MAQPEPKGSLFSTSGLSWKRVCFGTLRSLLRISILLYLGICGFLYFNQNQLIYPRHACGLDLSKETALAEIQLTGLKPYYDMQGKLLGYLSSNFSQSALRGTIFYFHGNGTWDGYCTNEVRALTQHGFRVFLYEFPGYGGRDGVPSEKVITEEVRQLIRDYSSNASPQQMGPFYLWGVSLGTGVAGAVAADPTLPIQGIVLVTPFDSLVNVSWSHYPYVPVPLLIHDHYDTYTNLAHFSHPIVVVQSGQDEVIPARLTDRLFEHLPEPKKRIIHPHSHHADWPVDSTLNWWSDALDFIAPPLSLLGQVAPASPPQPASPTPPTAVNPAR